MTAKNWQGATAVAFGAVVVLAACGTNAAAPTATVTVTQTVTAAPSAPAASGSPAVTPAAGYPKVVKISSMPEIVQSNAQAANPAEAIALAPGVWTAFPEGTTVAQAAAGGKLFGWCGPVKDYAEKAGGRGYTCY